jgi:hypothetical protein
MNITTTTATATPHFLDNLPAKYYSEPHIPCGRPYLKGEPQNCNEDKIGGERPFLRIGEAWPTSSSDDKPMRFVFQLSVPQDAEVPFKGKTIRLFMDDCDGELTSDNMHVSYIDYSEPFVADPKVPDSYTADLEPLESFRVLEWKKRKEFNFLAHELGEDDEELEVLANQWNQKHPDHTYDLMYIQDDIRNPAAPIRSFAFTGIKVGGYPTSAQSCEEEYAVQGMLLQIGIVAKLIFTKNKITQKYFVTVFCHREI